MDRQAGGERQRHASTAKRLRRFAFKLSLALAVLAALCTVAWVSSSPATVALSKHDQAPEVPESPAWIQYLQIYQRLETESERIAMFGAVIVWLAFLFAFVGLVASDYFCPNLSTLAARLGLSEGVAGSTLLAFGNGSPDVFSTFAALKSGAGALAIGELLGAAAFIVSVVAGSMCLVRPFKVAPHAFLRDVGFFTLAVAFTTGILADGRITRLEAGLMIALYACYVISVVTTSWWLRRKARQEALMKAVRSEYAEDEPYRDDEEAQPDVTPVRLARSRSNASSIRTLPAYADLSAEMFHAHIALDNSIEGLEERDADNAALLQLADRNQPVVISTRPRSMTVVGPVSPSLPQSTTIRARRPTARSAVRSSLLGAIEFRDVVNSLHSESSAHRQLAVFSGLHDSTLSPRASHISHRRAISASSYRRRRGSSTASTPLPSAVIETAASEGGEREGYFAGIKPVASAATGTLVKLDDDDVEPNPWNTTPTKSRNRISLAIPQHLVDAEFTASPLPQEQEVRRMPSIVLVRDTGDAVEIEPSHEQPAWSRTYSRRERLGALATALFSALFPSLQGWKDKSILGRIVALVSVPAIFALNITLPVVDDSSDEQDEYEHEEKPDEERYRDDPEAHPESSERHERAVAHELHRNVAPDRRPSSNSQVKVDAPAANGALPEVFPSSPTSEPGPSDAALQRIMTVTQCLLAPIFSAAATAGDQFWKWYIPVGAVGLGILFALVAAAATRKGFNGATKLYLCGIGFAVSIIWVMTIVNEIVGILQLVGVVLGLSDAIIGLSIFAMGNSLGDLVANLTIARMGFPSMALGAVYGGPMLNILLGVGLSGSFFIARKDKPYKIKFSPSLITTAVALLAILVATLIVVPSNGFLMTRRWGIGLISVYCILLAVNIIVEVKLG